MKTLQEIFELESESPGRVRLIDQEFPWPSFVTGHTDILCLSFLG